MAEGGEKFVIELDDSQLQSVAQQIIDALDKIGTKAQSSGKTLDDSMQQQAMSVKELSATIATQQKVVDELAQKYEQAKVAADNAFTGDPAKYQEAIALQEALKAEYDAESNALTTLEGQLKSMTNTEDKHNSVLVKMLGGQEKFNAILNTLPPTARMAITEISGMTAASKAFIATPIGAVLGVIALALSTLTTWFHSSAEGEEALAKVTGYFSGILGQLKEIVISVGKYIWKCFTDPKQAVIDFANAIKDNIVNRIKGLGDTFKVLGEMIDSVFSGDFNADKWNDMSKRLTDAQAAVATGIDNLSDKVANYGKQLANAAELSKKYNVEELEIHRARREASAKEAKIDAELAKLRNDMYKTGADKAAIQAKAEKLLNDKYETRLKLAERERNLQANRMELTSNTEADNDKLQELENNIVRLQAERESEMRLFNRAAGSYENSLTRAGNRDVKASNDIALSIQKETEQRKWAMIQAENELTAIRIETMDNGEKKVLAALELNAKKELDAIAKQKSDALWAKIDAEKARFDKDDANKGKTFDASTITLTDEELDVYDQLIEATKAKHEKALADQRALAAQTMNEYLAEYGTFEQQLTAITELYMQKRKDATTEGEKLSIDAEMQGALNGIIDNYISEVESMPQDTIEALIKALEGVKEANKGAFSQEQLDLYNQQIAILTDQLGSSNPFTAMKDAAAELKAAQQEVNDAISEQANAQGEVLQAQKDLEAVKNGKTVTKTDAKGSKVILDEKKAKDQLDKANAKLAKSTQRVQKAQDKEQRADKKVRETKKAVINVFQQAIGVVQQLGDAIGGTAGQVISIIGNIAQVALSSMSAMKATSEGTSQAIKACERASVILTIISVALEAAQQIFSLISGDQDAAIDRKIDKRKEKIDALKLTYDQLGEAAEETFSDEKRRLLKKLQELGLEIYRQYLAMWEEEHSKTHSSAEKEKDIMQNVIDLLKDMQKANKEAKDAIFGSDIQSAIEDFVDAYGEAWEIGGDRAKSAKEAARNMMKGIIKEAMKLAAQGEMNAIRQALEYMWTSDHELSDWEIDQIEQMGEQMAKTLEEKFAWAERLMGKDLSEQIESFADEWTSAWESGTSQALAAGEEVKKMMREMVKESIKAAIESSGKMKEIQKTMERFYEDEVFTEWEQQYIKQMATDLQKELGKQFEWAEGLFNDSYQQSSTSGGFAQASQDSVEELNGRFTAVQVNTTRLDQTCMNISAQISEQGQHLAAMRGSLEESISMQGMALEHLSAIEKNTRELYSMNERLAAIEENTRAL